MRPSGNTRPGRVRTRNFGGAAPSSPATPIVRIAAAVHRDKHCPPDLFGPTVLDFLTWPAMRRSGLRLAGMNLTAALRGRFRLDHGAVPAARATRRLGRQQVEAHTLSGARSDSIKTCLPCQRISSCARPQIGRDSFLPAASHPRAKVASDSYLECKRRPGFQLLTPAVLRLETLL
jgi:hypothetical protein